MLRGLQGVLDEVEFRRSKDQPMLNIAPLPKQVILVGKEHKGL